MPNLNVTVWTCKECVPFGRPVRPSTIDGRCEGCDTPTSGLVPTRLNPVAAYSWVNWSGRFVGPDHLVMA